MSEGFEKQKDSRRQESSVVSFDGLEASVEADPMKEEGAYVFKFLSEGAITNIRVVLNDYSGADVVITNMTTLPSDQTGKGLGSSAVKKVLAWAHTRGMRDIRAVQVQRHSEGFWEKNGFIKMEEPNPTNDFIFKKT